MKFNPSKDVKNPHHWREEDFLFGIVVDLFALTVFFSRSLFAHALLVSFGASLATELWSRLRANPRNAFVEVAEESVAIQNGFVPWVPPMRVNLKTSQAIRLDGKWKRTKLSIPQPRIVFVGKDSKQRSIRLEPWILALSDQWIPELKRVAGAHGVPVIDQLGIKKTQAYE